MGLKNPQTVSVDFANALWCYLSHSNPLDSSLRQFSCQSNTREGNLTELIKEPEARRESGFLLMMRRTTETETKRRSIPKHGGGKGHRRNCSSFAEGLLPSPGAVRPFVSSRWHWPSTRCDPSLWAWWSSSSLAAAWCSRLLAKGGAVGRVLKVERFLLRYIRGGATRGGGRQCSAWHLKQFS